MSAFSNKLSALALVATALSACSTESNGPSALGRQVSFQLSTRGASAAPAPGMNLSVAGSETYADANDTLVISQVQLVLREIEFERVNDTTCAMPDNDFCEELEVGPILLDLPLGTGAARAFTVAVDTGTFDEIEFEVHKPEDDPGDNQFLLDNPTWRGVSIRVTGTFNGTPFTFESEDNFEQEIDLSPPLSVTDSTAISVTLSVDLATWFSDGAGNLIDPATANKGGVSEDQVKNNIEQSFEAFEDEDHDGHDDSGPGSDDGPNHT